MIDDRLSSLDHHLEFQTAGREARFRLELCEQRDESRYLLRDRDLWQRHDEVIRQTSFIKFDQRGDKNIERAKAASAQLLIERLDAYADEGRQRVVLASFRRLSGG